MTKKCHKCQRHLDTNLFSQDAHSSDGLAWRCRECNAAASRAWKAGLRAARELKSAAAESAAERAGCEGEGCDAADELCTVNGVRLCRACVVSAEFARRVVHVEGPLSERALVLMRLHERAEFVIKPISLVTQKGRYST